MNYAPRGIDDKQKLFEIKDDANGDPALYYNGQPAADSYRPKSGGEVHVIQNGRIRALAAGERSRLAPGQFVGMWSMAAEKVTYKKFPALSAYIDRIGAKQFTYRRFGIVEMISNYPKVVVTIKLVGDSEIAVRGDKKKEFAPTKDECAAIKLERPGAALPKSINVSAGMLEQLREKVGRDAHLDVCIERHPKEAKDNIVMVEQRIEKAGGKKVFCPWTYWSDGTWQPMEPDGGLPLWKPLKPRFEGGGAPIMIHEGAKAAQAMDKLVNDPARREELARHPFGEVLKRYEHWGMLGGAYRVADVQWRELRAEKPNNVIYVCDNDYPGKSALKLVSRYYGKALKGIVFDKNWNEGWDLADEMPKDLFAKTTGKYVGPSWGDLLKSATWATTSEPNPSGVGRPVMKVRPEFAQEWIHCVTPEVYIHRDWPGQILIEKEFNHEVRAFSNVDDTARLLKADNASKTAILAYRPAKPPGIFSEEKGTYFNTHIGSQIVAVDGDAAPWLDYMTYMIPGERDRLEVMRWCATLIDRRDIKMLYALLLISEAQGIGKGTLGERVLLPLVGKNNASIPSEKEIVDSAFNYWSAHKRLAVVHEIYAGHSSKAYNTLKTIVTDKYIPVSKKFQANYEIENWIHIVACSNSKRALQLSMDDRRWSMGVGRGRAGY